MQATLQEADGTPGRKQWNERELKNFLFRKERAFVAAKYQLPVHAAKKGIPSGGISVLNGPCNNVDFESGNFTGWIGAVGYNDNTLMPLTIASNGISTLGLNSSEPTCSYHTLVTAAGGTDPYSLLPMLDPGGGNYAVRLGGENINILSFGGFGACSSGDTAGLGGSGGEILQQTFVVTTSNNLFTYAYSVVMDQVNHPNGSQPYFRIEVLDSTGAQTNTCHQYYVQEDSTGASPKGFVTSSILDSFGDSVYYLPWTYNAINLNSYLGKSITIRFTAAGCTLGGHFAYGYVDCSCSPLLLSLTGSAACIGNTVTIAAPPGASSYLWAKIPAGPGIVGSATGATCQVNQSGKYEVTITNGTCGYTIDTTITFVPAPAFTTTSTAVKCHGQNTGSATVTITGGGGPYTYSWSTVPSQTTASVTNLGAGTYTVSVMASNGCAHDSVITILQPPVLTLPQIPPVTICISQTEALAIHVTGGAQPYTYSWTGPGNVPVTSPVAPTTTTTYTVVVTDSNGCRSAPDLFQVNVNPPITLTAAGGKMICPGSSAALTANAAGGDNTYLYTWTPAAGLSSTTISNPVATPAATTTYTVIVNDGCGTPADSARVTVRVAPKIPVPVISLHDSIGCAPVCTFFFGSSDPPCVSAVWNFGDSTHTTGCGTVYHCYTQAGNYSIALTVTDSNGCTGTVNRPNLMQVNPVPVAAFTYSPEIVTMVNPQVIFTDKSTGASAWAWQFGDSLLSVSALENPWHTYSDTGCYPLTLVVENAFTCRDTARGRLCIKNEFSFYAPNAFTPNGDGKNDTWTPVGEDVDPNNYQLSIFDRWGNELFSTTTWGKGWNGTGPDNIPVQIDTYVWRATFRDLQHQRYTYTGSIQVIK